MNHDYELGVKFHAYTFGCVVLCCARLLRRKKQFYLATSREASVGADEDRPSTLRG